MGQSNKGLPTETRQKLGQVAHLNKAKIRWQEQGLDTYEIEEEENRLLKEIQKEIEENDKNE